MTKFIDLSAFIIKFCEFSYCNIFPYVVKYAYERNVRKKIYIRRNEVEKGMKRKRRTKRWLWLGWLQIIVGFVLLYVGSHFEETLCFIDYVVAIAIEAYQDTQDQGLEDTAILPDIIPYPVAGKETSDVDDESIMVWVVDEVFGVKSHKLLGHPEVSEDLIKYQSDKMSTQFTVRTVDAESVALLATSYRDTAVSYYRDLGLDASVSDLVQQTIFGKPCYWYGESYQTSKAPYVAQQVYTLYLPVNQTCVVIQGSSPVKKGEKQTLSERAFFSFVEQIVQKGEGLSYETN